MTAPSWVELAYAGGLFTGEGCITILRHKRTAWQPALVIEMTDLAPLERFQTAVGGLGKIRGPYHSPSRPAHTKPVYIWRVQTFEPAQAILAMLWPFLCPRRRARAVEVLDLCLAWSYPETRVAA